MTTPVPEPGYMLSADGAIRGTIKKFDSRPCRKKGCSGVRIHVLWPSGKSTYPCSTECHPVDGETWQISWRGTR